MFCIVTSYETVLQIQKMFPGILRQNLQVLQCGAAISKLQSIKMSGLVQSFFRQLGEKVAWHRASAWDLSSI